jgi:sugar phosphate isomerase/epimerase
MLIGAMNHPQKDVLDEIRWMADFGLDFIDLTLEPPASASWRVDPRAICRELERTGLKVVGHTAYYLPLESPFEEVRQGAIAEFKRCLEIFGEVGAKWMNVHPGRYTPMHPRSFFIERNLQSLRELMPTCERTGVGIMIENIPGDFNDVQQMSELLDPMPELGLHLDIGHSNLMVPHNTGCELIERYGNRLAHVHIHDNKGGHADLHLPLGTGSVDTAAHVAALKRAGYDGTITLEVFSPDLHFLDYSRNVLRKIWDEQEP